MSETFESEEQFQDDVQSAAKAESEDLKLARTMQMDPRRTSLPYYSANTSVTHCPFAEHGCPF